MLVWGGARERDAGPPMHFTQATHTQASIQHAHGRLGYKRYKKAPHGQHQHPTLLWCAPTRHSAASWHTQAVLSEVCVGALARSAWQVRTLQLSWAAKHPKLSASQQKVLSRPQQAAEGTDGAEADLSRNMWATFRCLVPASCSLRAPKNNPSSW